MGGTLYEGGQPDARLGDDAAPGLFRKRYRPLTADEMALHDAIKDKADELVALFGSIGGDLVPHPDRDVGANKQLAVRHLEDAVYRAVKALTA